MTISIPPLTELPVKTPCKVLDLLNDNEMKPLRTSLRDAINSRRKGMPQLEPILHIVAGGGNEKLLGKNRQLFLVACKATMHDLCEDDPNSDTTIFKRKNGGNSPFVFRSAPTSKLDNSNNSPILMGGVTVCLNGATPADTNELDALIHDFIGGVGLTLNRLGREDLYPSEWEGLQTMTLETMSRARHK